MAPARSFAAYRLALSTSSRDALPYLGVVLQDLTLRLAALARRGGTDHPSVESVGDSVEGVGQAMNGRDALPYLGVVLQDLTVINETAPDFDEGLVNWSKYQQVQAAELLRLAALARRGGTDHPSVESVGDSVGAALGFAPCLSKSSYWSPSNSGPAKTSTR
jgi:hypothetical protein